MLTIFFLYGTIIFIFSLAFVAKYAYKLFCSIFLKRCLNFWILTCDLVPEGLNNVYEIELNLAPLLSLDLLQENLEHLYLGKSGNFVQRAIFQTLKKCLHLLLSFHYFKLELAQVFITRLTF